MSIYVYPRGAPENGTLVCAHCRLPHAVTEEMQARYTTQAAAFGLSPDQVWECGACWLAHARHLGRMGPVDALRSIRIRTECTHPVPPFGDDA